MGKIFIVEDDKNIGSMLEYALKTSGFEVELFENSKEFWKILEFEIPSIVLLDIMLPQEDGISILENLKKMDRFKNIPVIMITAKCSEYDKIIGLDIGADDYITKPFSILEVISRIKAVLRRCQRIDNNTSILQVDEITLFKDKRRVLVKDKEINLTYKEFELLAYLMENQGIVISKEKILEKIWGFDYDKEIRTVSMHIRALRKKLLSSKNSIKTVRNVGYKIGE